METGTLLLKTTCGLVVLVCSNAISQVQDQPLPLSPVQIDQMWNEAQDLVKDGQLEEGADLYMAIAQGGPASTKLLNAALRAGHSYRVANLTDKAVESYDTVIAMATATAWGSNDERGTANDLRRSAVCNKASILDQAGRHEEAAVLYGGLVKEILNRKRPLANNSYARLGDTMEAAQRAAQCLERAGKDAEAVWYYDAIVTLSDARGWEEDGENVKTVYGIQNARADALFRKASACARAGQPGEARQAIQRLQAEFPDHPAVIRILPLETQLNGGSLQ
ncbi:MAG: tetratricopeptide repeat protein, partial [Planctomycetes bacterium]|nr:tetratricopeptide repeat protein [Planctomycetota bacterium]